MSEHSEESTEEFIEITVTGTNLTFTARNPFFGDEPEDTSLFDFLTAAVGA